MLQPRWQSRLDQARFHGTLTAGEHRWEVYFVEVSRVERDWIVECVVVGPRVTHVTIRCRSEVSHNETARRVMSALRDWLSSGRSGDASYLELTDTLEKVS